MPSFPDTVAVSRIECITGHRLYTEENISEGSKIAINHYNRQNVCILFSLFKKEKEERFLFSCFKIMNSVGYKF